MVSTELLATHTIRLLASQMVEKANSGHPGAPIGMAPVAHVLFSEFMKASSRNPKWLNRDRFILSNGHACALLYTMLHLTGYITMDDLKQFRQLGSITPGHPENFMTPGVEVCTGPLGQGIANAVGMAMASKHLGAKYNTPDFPSLIDHKIWIFCGDGCLQEGVSGEASSLAGHLKLDNLVLIYDDNKITIDGSTNLSFTEDVKMRYEAYGWNVIEVTRGNTMFDSIRAALQYARDSRSGKPTMIKLSTVIGYGTNKENTHGVHGSPLGKDSMGLFKKTLQSQVGSQYFQTDFEVPALVADHYQGVQRNGAHAYAAWMSMFRDYQQKHPAKAAVLTHIIDGTLPVGWDSKIMDLAANDTKTDATRKLGGKVLSCLAESLPHLVGGSADLTPSNKTKWKGSVDFQADSPQGRYFRFGVREHGMFAIANGMATYGMIPFTATFLNFITYGWGAVRLAALSKTRQIFIMTHDSIFLGEDGPTHQPIEVLALMRATPNLEVWRPASMVETVAAYKAAIERKHGPTVICLTRQKVEKLPTQPTVTQALLGAYKLVKTSSPVVRLLATGSEVGPCVGAAKLLAQKGHQAEVVSVPCMDRITSNLFQNLMGDGVPCISVEAATTFGWAKLASKQIGVDQFGKSGKWLEIQAYYGLNAEKIASQVEMFLRHAKL